MIYFEKDANPSFLKARTIVLIGYGGLGKPRANFAYLKLGNELEPSITGAAHEHR